MWTPDKNFMVKGFSTPTWRSNICSPPVRIPATERKWRSPLDSFNGDDFHVVHKVPAGDSPYVRAKHVQLVDKDPSRAVCMFWKAINAGDRVDSALKDMAVVMKQLNRSDEAIEAIKSFRHLCPLESQESLDNILLELYKRSGRTKEQIELLQVKLKHIEQGMAFGGKKSKMARSQGKKVQITIEQDYSRLLGNLAWAYLQQDNYKEAEEFYRKALSLEPDKNKQCNLAICLMYTQRMTEAKFLLRTVISSAIGNQQMDESYSKSYERAVQVMNELESEKSNNGSDVQTPFSVLLHRISAEGYKKETTPKTAPQTVFEKHTNRGCFTGGPYEKRADSGHMLTGGNVQEAPYTEPRRLLFSSQKRDLQTRGWEREDTVGSCSKRLLFNQKMFSGLIDENTNCNIIQESRDKYDETENLRQKMESLILNEGYYHTQPGVKRSLCFETYKQNFNAENLPLTSSPLQMKALEFGGYESALGTEKVPLTSSALQKKALEFGGYDTYKQNFNAENLPLTSSPLQKKALEFGGYQSALGTEKVPLTSSSLQKKALEFGGYESALGMENEGIFGNSVESGRRDRLQVFRDITLYSEISRV